MRVSKFEKRGYFLQYRKISRADNLKDGLNGIEFLRDLVSWLNYRPEDQNEEKTPSQLITEYKKALKKDDM